MTNKGHHVATPSVRQASRKSEDKRWPFVARHKHALSLIGAGIVFFTFVVKEGIVENARDRSSDLDLRYATFLINGTNSRIETSVSTLSSTVEDQLIPVIHKGRGSVEDTDAAVITLNFQAFADSLTRLQGSVANSKDFLSIVPHSAPIDAELDRLSHNIQVLHNGQERTRTAQAKQAEEEQKAFLSEDVHQMDLAHTQALSLEVDLRSLCAVSNRMEASAATLKDKALEAATNYRQTLERRRRFSQYIAMILYALGWAIGFSGRLFNVDDLPTSDET